MKHLKSFNESTNLYYNSEIEYDDLCILRAGAIPFTDKEYNDIITIFGGENYKQSEKKPFSFIPGTYNYSNTSKTIHCIGINYYNSEVCEICKLEDDWFLLKIGSRKSYKCYKCDTLGGVKKVVESSDIQIIKESEEYINTKIDFNVSRKVISDSIPFTDNDFEYIKKECELLDITVKKEKYINLDNNLVTHDCIVLRIKYKLNNIKVFKLEDDWFIVFVSTKAYKCDGLEGLIEVIKREKWNI